MSDLTQQEQDDDRRVPCPECPDGQVWTREGPTGRTCGRCKGHAVIWTTDNEDDGEDTNVEDSYAR